MATNGSGSEAALEAEGKGELREITVDSVVLGIVLALVLGAANVYLGLKVGMTVSASIPAAVISMGILRGVLRRGSILENNIVQTMASAGESVASGVIFTIPALVIAGVWTDFRFWPTTLIAMLGSILGVFFMVPLRRVLIIEEKELKYPEGLACAEVLKAGETGGRSLMMVAAALVVGTLVKVFTAGFTLFRGTLEGAVRLGGAVAAGGLEASPALVSVGFIVGLDVAWLMFLGGALGWFVAMPIIGMVYGIPDGPTLDACTKLWKEYVRFLGVGAMVVGGLSSIVRVRKGIVKGITSIMSKTHAAGEEAPKVERTEQNLGLTPILVGLGLAILAIFGLYMQMIGSVGYSALTTVIMVIAAFFFVAVSSYICGLVGSSNNPVSGMTICTVLFSGAVMLLIGMAGQQGIIAALCVAGVVCCAACTAGDISQDLKTGYLVGGTPRAQQLTMILGVVVSSFVMAPVLTLLHKAYTIGSPALNAPQAALFAKIAEAMFGKGGLPWTLIGIGAVLGLLILWGDSVLEKRGGPVRLYLMPVAVGLYLPFVNGLPILLGGVVAWLVKRKMEPQGEMAAKRAEHKGVLVSSGLIAGEAIAGIVLAAFIGGGFEMPIKLIDPESAVAAVTSALMMLGVLVGLYQLSLASEPAGAGDPSEEK